MANTARRRAPIVQRGPALFGGSTWVVKRREPTVDQRYLGTLLDARDHLDESGPARCRVDWESGVIHVGDFFLGDARGSVRATLGPDLTFAVTIQVRFDYWAPDVRRAGRFACWVLGQVLEAGARMENLRPVEDKDADWECRVKARCGSAEEMVQLVRPLFLG